MDGLAGGRRWPWLLAATLFVAAGLGAARSAYLFWMPCHDSLLTGSLIRVGRLDAEFSDACLRRMDSGSPFLFVTSAAHLDPWTAGDLLPVMTIAALAGLVLALGLRWSWRTKMVAAVPGLATLALAVLAYRWDRDPGSMSEVITSGWVTMLAGLIVVPVLVAIWTWEPWLRGLRFLCLVVILNGAVAFGIFHGMFDYLLMIIFNSNNWDSPPGSGASICLWLLAAAIFAVMGATDRRTARSQV